MFRFTLLAALLAAVTFGSMSALAQGTSSASAKGLNARDKTDELGIGLQAGSLTGVNLQYWATANRTINGSLTSEFGNTALAVSHNWYFHDTFKGQFNNFVPFIGAGVIGAWGSKNDSFRKNANEDFGLAVQVPLGIEFLPHMRRFSVFAEFAPSLEVTPANYGFLTGDVGARYFF
jgi:hypothetical protein